MIINHFRDFEINITTNCKKLQHWGLYVTDIYYFLKRCIWVLTYIHVYAFTYMYIQWNCHTLFNLAHARLTTRTVTVYEVHCRQVIIVVALVKEGECRTTIDNRTESTVLQKLSSLFLIFMSSKTDLLSITDYDGMSYIDYL